MDGDGDLDVLSASSSNNKIIWYENLGGLDFGDAPAPYPVLLSENGARHAPTGLTLGSNRDGEADGTHSLNADADGVDEAGVTLGTIRVGQSGVTISVAVSGSAGKLDAWIDFNGDGSWGGVGEQIFASQSVVVGTNNLAFDVPSLAVAGKSFARFRLSTAGGLTPTGSAADGEVEDYKVIVIPLPPTITGPSSVTSSLRPGINWTGVPGASNYEIWIKNQSTGVNPFHRATGNGGTYIPTADLGIGRFNLWMRSRGPDGADSLYTGQYNFTIQTPAVMHDPGPSLATHRPTLTWDPLPGAVKYDLWIDSKLPSVSSFIRNQNVTGTSWTPSTDMPLGLYHAWVRGIAADGTPGGWSATRILSVMPAPTVTQGINSTFDRTPTFAWNPLLGAAEYEVFVRNRNTSVTTLYQQYIAALSFTPATALADGPYRVWVVGVSSSGVQSLWTAPIDISIGGQTNLLTPTGTTTDSTPAFTWRPVDGAVHYDLWVNQVGGTSQITAVEDPGRLFPAAHHAVFVAWPCRGVEQL